jgi:dUTP pyrophosphatase
LKLYVEGSAGANENDLANLKNMYKGAIMLHNHKMFKNQFPDAGFDLFAPELLQCYNNGINKLKLKVKCAAQMICENGRVFNTGFYMYPRSSTGSKTPLRLANSVGIIDAGYRGEVMAVFDCKHEDFTIQQYDKMVQLCAPGLVPIYVTLVDDVLELSEETNRGEGGFGSTGK